MDITAHTELTVTLKIGIDNLAWAREYGVLFSEVEADVLGYFDSDVIASTLNAKRALGPLAQVHAATVALAPTVTITTTYHGPTNTHGSRIVAKATINGKRAQATIPYDHAQRDMHEHAALTFAGRNGLDHVKFAAYGDTADVRTWTAS